MKPINRSHAHSKLYRANFWALIALFVYAASTDIWSLAHGKGNLTDLAWNLLAIASLFGASAGKKWWYLLFRIETILAVLGAVMFVLLAPTVGRTSHSRASTPLLIVSLVIVIAEAGLMATMLRQIDARWSSPTLLPGSRKSASGGWAELGSSAARVDPPKPGDE